MTKRLWQIKFVCDEGNTCRLPPADDYKCRSVMNAMVDLGVTHTSMEFYADVEQTAPAPPLAIPIGR